MVQGVTRRRTGIAILAAGVLTLAPAAWVAAAQSQKEPSGRVVIAGHATSLAEERRALKEANAQAQSARAQSRRMEAKAKAATAEADRLNARAAALAAQIQESEADLRAGRARIAIINRLIADQSVRLAKQREPMARLTAALQSFARRPPVLALLQPGSLADTVHARAALAHVMPVIRQRTAVLRGELDRTRQLRALAVLTNKALRDGRVKLAQQRGEARKLEAERRLAAQGLATGASREAERAMAMSERARDIDELMGRIGEADKLREQLAALPGPELRPTRPGGMSPEQATSQDPPYSAAYRLPVTGEIVTGMGELSDSGVRARGITVAARSNARIIAPAGGHVAFAGPYRGFGQIVIIDHGNDWTSLLTGMGRLSVAAGQTVDQGAPIGTAGSGNHPAVTLELRRQGRPVDILAMVADRQ